MTFISYAQNYEDVMLWRALKHIEKGFYVDVGAMDPIIDSVTKAFYERGWHGINIEPIHHWYSKLLIDRPEDLNLNVAISDQPGVLRLFDVQESGLSTRVNDFAEKHLKELGFQYQEIVVPAKTLDSVLEGVNCEIHFLKIDVEGAEKQVIASIDLRHRKPWVILAEATKPLSQQQNYEEWEIMLIDRGYIFVYFDGVNRFYVSPDKKDLIPVFDSPPNFFDDFIRFEHWNTQTKLDAKETECTQAVQALNSLNVQIVQLAELRGQLAELRGQLAEIMSSKTWRIALLLRRIWVKIAPQNSPRAQVLLLLMKIIYLPFKKIRNHRRVKHNLSLVKTSAHFDREWYLANNPDIAQARVDPLLHFLNNGGFEGRDPGPNFCSAWYLNTYIDVKDAGINPLIHYLKFGKEERRIPKPVSATAYDISFPEDEGHFMDLFQRELSQRQREKTGGEK